MKIINYLNLSINQINQLINDNCVLQRLCDWRGCGSGVLTRGSGYQFLTLTPYYDSVPWNYGSKAAIKTSAQFTGNVDVCLMLTPPPPQTISFTCITVINLQQIKIL